MSRDMKVPRYSYPRLPDDLSVGPSLYSTDLKVRGYLNSRLSDEFSNSATNLFVRGCEKDTKSILSNRIFFVFFLENSFKKCDRLNKGMRLKDAVPKANSRGFLNPWN